jgi:two-component system response regulator AdeR
MILVVDDDPDVGDLLCRLLERVGRTAEHVSGADDAMRFVRMLRPSVVVLDLHMPGRDGLQLLAAMRQEGGGDVPVLFYSAESADAPRREAERLGAEGWVVKGLGGWQELLVRISEIMGGDDNGATTAAADRPVDRPN